mmetsp:Transcript_24649/g.73930  ORF Transcript_24649/g.73930 Transcript_24649/m.73930 type:complete len:207 (+) Transcript_24649:248-868(+)
MQRASCSTQPQRDPNRRTVTTLRSRPRPARIKRRRRTTKRWGGGRSRPLHRRRRYTALPPLTARPTQSRTCIPTLAVVWRRQARWPSMQPLPPPRRRRRLGHPDRRARGGSTVPTAASRCRRRLAESRRRTVTWRVRAAATRRRSIACPSSWLTSRATATVQRPQSFSSTVSGTWQCAARCRATAAAVMATTTTRVQSMTRQGHLC